MYNIKYILMPRPFYCENCVYTCITAQHYEKHLATRKHYKNTHPSDPKQEFHCNMCMYTCYTPQNYTKHLETRKHQKITLHTSTFYCESCDYTCKTLQKYTNHLNTRIHLHAANKHICNICNKSYKYESGLRRHKKATKCGALLDTDLLQTIIGLSKNMQHPQHITNNTNNTNSFNKTLNLQIFLNKTCKDAINIGEFIDNIKISLNDLNCIGDKGYVKGISNIIIKNLADLDETKRPVHCSDIKRETIYIKDNDAWEKEQIGHPKMVKAVKQVSSKSISQLKPWRDANPGCDDPNSHVSDTYQAIVRESCESGETIDSKIVKQVAKKVSIHGR
jgi:hypothetical protein